MSDCPECLEMTGMFSPRPNLRVRCAESSDGELAVLIDARYAMTADECRTLADWLVKAADWIDSQDRIVTL
jgi:hypothetical protein